MFEIMLFGMTLIPYETVSTTPKQRNTVGYLEAFWVTDVPRFVEISLYRWKQLQTFRSISILFQACFIHFLYAVVGAQSIHELCQIGPDSS